MNYFRLKAEQADQDVLLNLDVISAIVYNNQEETLDIFGSNLNTSLRMDKGKDLYNQIVDFIKESN